LALSNQKLNRPQILERLFLRSLQDLSAFRLRASLIMMPASANSQSWKFDCFAGLPSRTSTLTGLECPVQQITLIALDPWHFVAALGWEVGHQGFHCRELIGFLAGEISRYLGR
jgi:hypothetical protein